MTVRTIVYKLGGSLLDLPDLDARLSFVVSATSDCRPLLIVGGGPIADVVRDWDREHALGEERAHWLALDSLFVCEELVLALTPGMQRVANRLEAEQAWDAGNVPVLSTAEFVRAEEHHQPVALPHSWDATSDTIAAWVATVWPADELVLLKSTDISERIDIGDAAKRGLVDRCFPAMSDTIGKVGWLNLRAAPSSSPQWIQKATSQSIN
jgi:aspartokinase-like uncharacterized kinase